MTRLGPIHISEDVISLSAILLDDEYYRLLKTNVKVIDEISVLDLEHIILFKMKAWLDLSNRKASGEKIDNRDIKKHKNDVFRLAANIEKNVRVVITGQVKEDAQLFIEQSKENFVDLKSLGIRKTTYEELVEVLSNCYI